jgi:hypothetical protein
VDGKDLKMSDHDEGNGDDRFLREQRRDPEPEFSRSLRARLRAGEDPERARPGFRLHPAFAGALAAAALAVAFTFPAVRATAQQMLDLFRVREFAVVQIDENRIAKLRDSKLDPAAIFRSSVETLQEPGPPRRFADAASARAAGYEMKLPTYLASSLAPDTVIVQGESRARFTIDTGPLRDMMDLMDVRDLDLPADLDGQRIEARMPVMVVQTYRGEGRRRGMFLQAESPEVSLPHGVDLPRLGEIGLRLMGVDRGEARRLSTAIDWRATLLVPVVGTATRFEQVSVNGDRGLMLDSREMKAPDGTSRGSGRVLMWTHQGRVYAMMGSVQDLELVQMAESVR